MRVLRAKPTAPSVECMLHGLFPQTFVLHLHPALVNGLTCGVDGKQACEELFGEKAVWVPLTKPGYTLAKACFDMFASYQRQARHGAFHPVYAKPRRDRSGGNAA